MGLRRYLKINELLSAITSLDRKLEQKVINQLAIDSRKVMNQLQTDSRFDGKKLTILLFRLWKIMVF